jgi:two-component system, LytTR family, sensor kinase
MKLEFSKPRNASSAIVLAVATFIALVFFGQGFFTYASMNEPFHWEQHVLWTFTGWYLWAAFFPFILRFARRFRYERGTLVRTIVLHASAAIGIAVLHASIQTLIVHWLFHPERTSTEFLKIAREGGLFGWLVFWRFAIFQAILAVCYAWDYFRRSKETELNAIQLEDSIFRTQMQTLKMQLEPQFLFRCLRSLSSLMHNNLRAADRFVARLGDYLRMTLDNAQHREVPLRKELEFVRCTMEIEKIHNPDSPSIQFQISTQCFDWPVPNRSIQPAVEAILKRDHPNSISPGQIIVEAGPDGETLLVHIHDSRPLRDSDELESLQTTINDLNVKRSQEIAIKLEQNGEGVLAVLKIDSKIKNKAETEIRKQKVEEPQDPPSNPVKRWGIIVSVWSGLAAYFFLMYAYKFAAENKPIPWADILFWCSTWFLWALCTPFILAVIKKYPLRRGVLLRNGLIHLGANAALMFYTSIGFAVLSWITTLGEKPFLDVVTMVFRELPFSMDMLVYWSAVAVISASRYRRHYIFSQTRESKLNAQLARAQLQALKMQLHPHFLFNTLNSISELMQEDIRAAEKMLDHLEHFLRLTVNNSEAQEVPFEQELEFLKCYLAIEHVRFQDRLSIRMDIEPQTLLVAVPNLLLQPIVENAIRHGIAPRTSPGTIEIQAKKNNGILHVRVQDNGPGLSDDQRKTAPLKKGLGLSNTRERLQQLYGKSHRFELENAPEGGLVVTVEIPDQNHLMHEIKTEYR